MNSAARWTVTVVLLMMLSPIAAGGTATADVQQSGDTPRLDAPDSAANPSGVLAVQTADDEDNETDRHRNPDEYESEGDLEGLASWLSGRLASQLGDSAIQLSEGEYELAQEFIGDEYRDRLGQYVDVAGEIDGESYEDTFRETRDEQESLTDLLEQYQETKAAYDAAVAEGNTERARELARRLDGLADEIDLTTDSLQERYEQIESATGEDLSEAIESLEATEDEILTEVSTILSSEFIETELTVDIDEETISFLDPLSATGRLTTVDGEPIANESIRMDLGEQSLQITTDANGSFSFDYRPTLLPLSTASLTVKYVPENRSLYLGSEASVNVTVEQVQPRFAGVDGPDELAYADPSPIVGKLLVEAIPVDGVPIEVVVDDQQVGTLTTSNGSFVGNLTVPASISDGNRTLSLRLPTENQSLAPVLETQSVTVRETETRLVINATDDDGQIMLNGTLATDSGVGVERQPVQIQIEGTTVGTLTTGTGGAFSEAFSVPDSVDEELVRVSATYRGAGTNLVGSENETVVSVTLVGQSGNEADADGIVNTATDAADGIVNTATDAADGIVNTATDAADGIPALLWGLLAVLFGSILGVLWLGRTRAPEDIPFSDNPVVRSLVDSLQVDSEDSSADSQGEKTKTVAAEQSSQPAVAALLQQASAELQSGSYGTAVQACYSAVRQDLAAQIGGAEALTHWEFYQAYSETEQTGSGLDALRELTEEYEYAAFSGEAVTQDHAQRVLTRARKLCDVTDDAFAGTSSIADD